MALQKGDRVQPRAKGSSKGTIVKATDHHTWNVQFDDGTSGVYKSRQLKTLPKDDGNAIAEAIAEDRRIAAADTQVR
jgi:hypothetical protein